MNWQITIREDARVDIRQARDWYESRRPGLGDEFLLAITDAFMSLEEFPLRWPVYYNGFRRLITDRFPYKIFYRVEDQDVIVFSVLHVSRDHTRDLS